MYVFAFFVATHIKFCSFFLVIWLHVCIIHISWHKLSTQFCIFPSSRKNLVLANSCTLKGCSYVLNSYPCRSCPHLRGFIYQMPSICTYKACDIHESANTLVYTEANTCLFTVYKRRQMHSHEKALGLPSFASDLYCTCTHVPGRSSSAGRRRTWTVWVVPTPPPPPPGGPPTSPKLPLGGGLRWGPGSQKSQGEVPPDSVAGGACSRHGNTCTYIHVVYM